MDRLPTNKHKIAFALMIISGTALCVGGIWVAPLLIPGSALLSGAVGMYSGTCTEDPRPGLSSNVREIHECDENDEIDINVHGEPIVNQFHMHLRHRHGDHSEHLDLSSDSKPRVRPR